MNMKFAAIAVLSAFSLAAMAPRAGAADNGFYLGAGVTQTNFDLTVDDADDSTDDNGFKIIAGWRPLDFFAVEANYSDLGGLDEDGVSVDSSLISVNALLLAEIGIVDLYARAGYANWDSEISVSGVGSLSDDGWEPIYGAGVGLHFGSFGLRAEYEYISVDAFDNVFDEFESNAGVISVSFTYTFL